MSIEFVEKKRWLFLGLPFTFTKYVIKEDMITVDTGVFTKVENDCYMYKVQDVELVATFFERIAGLGTEVSGREWQDLVPLSVIPVTLRIPNC